MPMQTLYIHHKAHTLIQLISYAPASI